LAAVLGNGSSSRSSHAIMRGFMVRGSAKTTNHAFRVAVSS